MRINKNKLAMFHTHDLSNDAIDYIITHCNAVAIITRLEKSIKLYSMPFITHFSYMDKEKQILDELKDKIDIFNK